MSLKLLVGLGNPGASYEWTRHNAGFRVITEFGIKYDAEFSLKTNLNSEIAKILINSNPIYLSKPNTYMNLSGKAVYSLATFYKFDPSSILVVHDDVSLPLGKIRFQKAGGAGGQHGIESIINSLQTKDFLRLKIGVGPDPGGAMRADYVLSQFNLSQKAIFAKVCELACAGIETLIISGISKAMNQYNCMDLNEIQHDK